MRCQYCFLNRKHECKQDRQCYCCGSSKHGTLSCPQPKCIFNCGHCAKNQLHNCRKCGAICVHRTENCPENIKKQQSSEPHVSSKYASASSVPHVSSKYASASSVPHVSPKNASASSVPHVLPKNASASSVSIFSSIFSWLNSSSCNLMLGDYDKYSGFLVTMVSICIYLNGRVLVASRGVHDINYGKTYTQGGRVDRGETPEQAALRELEEESGLKLRKEDIEHSGVIDVVKMKDGNYFVHFFAVLNKNPKFDNPTTPHEIITNDDLANRLKVHESYRLKHCKGICWINADILINEEERYSSKSIKQNIDRVHRKYKNSS